VFEQALLAAVRPAEREFVSHIEKRFVEKEMTGLFRKRKTSYWRMTDFLSNRFPVLISQFEQRNLSRLFSCASSDGAHTGKPEMGRMFATC
jgi:hypothetical protein